MKEHAPDTIGLALAKVATFGGAGGAFFFGMTAQTVAALGGLAIGLIGLAVQIAYTWHKARLDREDRRERRAEHHARMEEYRGGKRLDERTDG